jgi:GDP-4-dehydro-6-deoxy-D-mannose reductase
LEEARVRVGNLDVERDFLDVRDVATAYAVAIRRSAELEPGLVLNLGSGVSRSIADMLAILVERSKVPVRVERDPARFRPNDRLSILVDNGLARRLLGWKPAYSIEETLAIVLDECRARAAAETAAIP